jgi:hypothetical protein
MNAESVVPVPNADAKADNAAAAAGRSPNRSIRYLIGVKPARRARRPMPSALLGQSGARSAQQRGARHFGLHCPFIRDVVVYDE